MPITIPLEKLRALKEFVPPAWGRFTPLLELGERDTFVHVPPELRGEAARYQQGVQIRRLMFGITIAVLTSGAVAGVAGTLAEAPLAFCSVPLLAAYFAPRVTRADYFHHYRRPVLFVVLPTLIASGIATGIGYVLTLSPLGILGGATASAVVMWFAADWFFTPPKQPSPMHFPDPRPEREVLRGPVIHKEQKELDKIYQAALFNLVDSVNRLDDGSYAATLKPYDVFGAVPIARGSASNSHTLVMGMTGSGKTVSLRSMMATLLPLPVNTDQLPERNPVREGQRREIHQAIVYDAKTENIPILCGHGFVPRRDLFILNPFDQRAVAWDMARDIRTPSQAKLLAETLLRTNVSGDQHAQHHQYFRNNAARQIRAVVEAFIHCGGEKPRWTFRDIINAFSTPETLRHVLSHHPEGGPVISSTLEGSPETVSNIFSSTTTYLDEFRILASLWHRIEQEQPAPGGTTKLSLTDWVQEGNRSVLLLPNTRENETIITPLNQLIFKRLSDLLLNSTYNKHVETGENNVKRRRAVVLDECPTLGKLNGLNELLAEGREFGVQVILGVQAFSQMVSAYGEHEAKTILGQCGFKAFLKCDGSSAEWASKEIGQQLERYRQMSYTVGQSGSTTHTTSANGSSTSSTSGWNRSETSTYTERIQDAVLASELRSLPDPIQQGGIVGMFLTPHLPVWAEVVFFDQLPYIQYQPGNEPKRIDADTSSEWLPPWGDADFSRLGLKPMKAKESHKPHTPAPPKMHTTRPPVSDPQDLF